MTRCILESQSEVGEAWLNAEYIPLPSEHFGFDPVTTKEKMHGVISS